MAAYSEEESQLWSPDICIAVGSILPILNKNKAEALYRVSALLMHLSNPNSNRFFYSCLYIITSYCSCAVLEVESQPLFVTADKYGDSQPYIHSRNRKYDEKREPYSSL